MDKLVSVITPTYNYGHLIHRLLDSVMNQTYDDIEMFVIDDGSTDNTKGVVEPYIENFAKAGKKLQYIYQENLGLASAINTGLRNINGEYLVWPDADDWYNTDTAIADLVEVFEKSPDSVGSVRGMQYCRNEKTLKIIGKRGIEDKAYHKNMFEQALLQKSDWWVNPGSIMIRTKHLFCYYPNKEIFSPHHAQNGALLLPILYDFDCITINKYIYNVIVSKKSDSRKRHSYSELIKRYGRSRKMLTETLRVIKNMPKTEYDKLVKRHMLRLDIICAKLAFAYKKKADFISYYRAISENDPEATKKFKLKVFFSKIPFGYDIHNMLAKVKGFPKKIFLKY